MGGVRRAATYDHLRPEPPDCRARAQRGSEHPTAALVRKGQQRRHLPTQLAEQTRELRRRRNTPSARERPGRPPKGEPAEQSATVEERPEARTPLHICVTRGAIPAGWRGGDHGDLPAQPGEVLRDARPAQAPDRAVWAEIVGYHPQPAEVAHPRPSEPWRASMTSSRNALRRPRCSTRQASP